MTEAQEILFNARQAFADGLITAEQLRDVKVMCESDRIEKRDLKIYDSVGVSPLTGHPFP